MFDFGKKSKTVINSAEFRDKVLGCWTGKNIGGTLGAPFENKQKIFNVSFYTTDLKGNPIPNDDLDLQLAWLRAVEQNGIYHVNERVLGEYWLNYVVGPWEEYGICRANMINGLYPPLSGLCNNPVWHNGNGAWIRSEIWACIFAGAPDDVVDFAWYDACCDHSDDGIYAEVFVAVLEAAAFIENDIRKLIEIGLKRIPADCRVARAVRVAIAEYEAGHDFVAARNAVVKDSEDIGWFHAPANVAFAVIGLLYGENDFAKTICTAVNCGDDADCTGATSGAIMGILKGRSGIPQEWIEPIGESIKTVAVNPYTLALPETLDELTDRVIAVRKITSAENATLPHLTEGPTFIDELDKQACFDGSAGLKRLNLHCSRRLKLPVSWNPVEVEYGESPVMKPGSTQKMRVLVRASQTGCTNATFRWLLPDGWHCSPSPSQTVMLRYGNGLSCEFEITMPENPESFTYITVEVRHSSRNMPEYITVPFAAAGTVETNSYHNADQEFWDNLDRIRSRVAK